jgi:hypothetical protein
MGLPPASMPSMRSCGRLGSMGSSLFTRTTSTRDYASLVQFAEGVIRPKASMR